MIDLRQTNYYWFPAKPGKIKHIQNKIKHIRNAGGRRVLCEKQGMYTQFSLYSVEQYDDSPRPAVFVCQDCYGVLLMRELGK